MLIRNNSDKNKVTLDLHQEKADKSEDQWLKEKKFQHKWYYYRKVAWLKHRCWMLIAVGLIQHLCKSKAISHSLQHLRIRSTASKYSETKSSFSCTTSRVCEVPGTSVKAFLIYARMQKRNRTYLLLFGCFQGIMMAFGVILPRGHRFRPGPGWLPAKVITKGQPLKWVEVLGTIKISTGTRTADISQILLTKTNDRFQLRVQCCFLFGKHKIWSWCLTSVRNVWAQPWWSLPFLLGFVLRRP